eukprot:CAMPEP_0119139824 /NCGR_PEP_ID=MMETSP1310-20130426/28187_1 /TAXON_ID=464262 /ORGANISM="Genus nov. species nov., Strain RCC2339" /LENGTH=309 /DNA_ID=CAMNT_0007131147 /DNA_START=31 /DNA_END=955 /DNA_ORIENTATION=+
MASTMGTARGTTQGVVPPAGAQLGVLARAVHRALLHGDGAGGLEGHADDDVLPVGDAALDAPRAVGPRPHLPSAHVELVVVLAAQHPGALKAAADLEAFARRERHHRPGQVGLELVEHRGAQAPRAAPHDAGHPPAAALPPVPHVVDGGDHPLRRRLVRAPHDVGLDVGHGHGGGVHLALHVLHGAHPAEHLRAAHLLQQLLGHGPRGDPPDGLPRAAPAPACDAPHPVLGIVCRVRMARPICHCHLAVVLGALIPVRHDDGDGGAQGDAVQHAGHDLGGVALLARRREARLAGAAAVELRLDLLQAHL